jgi:hypothetical protein
MDGGWSISSNVVTLLMTRTMGEGQYSTRVRLVGGGQTKTSSLKRRRRNR